GGVGRNSRATAGAGRRTVAANFEPAIPARSFKMNCQEIVTLKHAYADRELDLVRTTEIERHLSGCRACSQASENIRALSSALKSSDLYFEAPAHLQKRTRACLGAENTTAPTL